MNRAVIAVKSKHKNVGWRVIRIHWNYGRQLEDWLQTNYPDHESALKLISEGHRSSTTEPHQVDDPASNHWEISTLKAAKLHCEYITFAWHNGKQWRFSHLEQC